MKQQLANQFRDAIEIKQAEAILDIASSQGMTGGQLVANLVRDYLASAKQPKVSTHDPMSPKPMNKRKS